MVKSYPPGSALRRFFENDVPDTWTAAQMQVGIRVIYQLWKLDTKRL